MSVKTTVRKQYQILVDRAADRFGGLPPELPPEGWIATARKALGMSGAQLAKRLGITRSTLSKAELSEVGGSVTLKTMRAAAEAMGCRFVYVIVPAGRSEEAIAAQARKKARAIVTRASAHMALEQQALTVEQNEEEIERVAQDLIREMPRDLWSDQ